LRATVGSGILNGTKRPVVSFRLASELSDRWGIGRNADATRIFNPGIGYQKLKRVEFRFRNLIRARLRHAASRPF
jgi:hypothetical protein